MSMTGNMAPKKSKKKADPKDKPDKRRKVSEKSSGRATWKKGDGDEVSDEDDAISKTLGSCHVFLIVMFWHLDSFIELLSKYKRHFASVLCK